MPGSVNSDQEDNECFGSTPLEPNSLFEKVSEFLTNKPPTLDYELDAVLKPFDDYQESPQLLDPYLYDIVQKCSIVYFENLKKENNKENEFARTWPCKIIYTLAKVRGPKIIAKCFPSDVSYLLEITTRLSTVISKEAFSVARCWQEDYFLLLWLSVLVLAPFPLKTFGENTLDTIYEIALNFLKLPGKERDASAILLARLLSRTDVKDLNTPTLKSFQELILDIHKKTSTGSSNSRQLDKRDVFLKLGVLATISNTCKLLSSMEVYNIFCSDNEYNIITNGLLTDKPPAELVGGYLYDKLVVKCLSKVSIHLVSLLDDPLFENIDNVSELLEIIFDRLFDTLGNSNTIVRYSCAKAIASITVKLPADFQDDILQNVFSIFPVNKTTGEFNFPTKSDAAYDAIPMNLWHGHFLLIAELLRRNVAILSFGEDHYDGETVKMTLSNFLSMILFASRFEQEKLTYTVGMIIRDATCYICWSLFRSTPLLIQMNKYLESSSYNTVTSTFIQQLANILINMSCFDKEINIRRAASAAIQEGIGRLNNLSSKNFTKENQGKDPAGLILHGMEIVQILDFFNLSNLERSYLEIAPKLYHLGQKEYSTSILEFLLSDFGIGHISIHIRKLSAKSIAQIINLEQEDNARDALVEMIIQDRLINKRIPKLSKYSQRSEFHGVYYTIAEILGNTNVNEFNNIVKHRQKWMELIFNMVVFGEFNGNNTEAKNARQLHDITKSDLTHGDLSLSDLYVHLVWCILVNKDTHPSLQLESMRQGFFLSLFEVLKMNNSTFKVQLNEEMQSLAKLVKFGIVPNAFWNNIVDYISTNLEQEKTQIKQSRINKRGMKSGGGRPLNIGKPSTSKSGDSLVSSPWLNCLCFMSYVISTTTDNTAKPKCYSSTEEIRFSPETLVDNLFYTYAVSPFSSFETSFVSLKGLGYILSACPYLMWQDSNSKSTTLVGTSQKAAATEKSLKEGGAVVAAAASIQTSTKSEPNNTQNNKALQWRYLAALLDGMQNYTTDSRGDIGSWTRKDAMKRCFEIIGPLSESLRSETLQSLNDATVEKNIQLFKTFVIVYVGNLLRICGELLDSLRSDAIQYLSLLEDKLFKDNIGESWLPISRLFKSIRKKSFETNSLEYFKNLVFDCQALSASDIIFTTNSTTTNTTAGEDSIFSDSILATPTKNDYLHSDQVVGFLRMEILQGLVVSAGGQQASQNLLNESFNGVLKLLAFLPEACQLIEKQQQEQQQQQGWSDEKTTISSGSRFTQLDLWNLLAKLLAPIKTRQELLAIKSNKSGSSSSLDPPLPTLFEFIKFSSAQTLASYRLVSRLLNSGVDMPKSRHLQQQIFSSVCSVLLPYIYTGEKEPLKNVKRTISLLVIPSLEICQFLCGLEVDSTNQKTVGDDNNHNNNNTFKNNIVQQIQNRKSISVAALDLLLHLASDCQFGIIRNKSSEMVYQVINTPIYEEGQHWQDQLDDDDIENISTVLDNVDNWMSNTNNKYKDAIQKVREILLNKNVF